MYGFQLATWTEDGKESFGKIQVYNMDSRREFIYDELKSTRLVEVIYKGRHVQYEQENLKKKFVSKWKDSIR